MTQEKARKDREKLGWHQLNKHYDRNPNLNTKTLDE